MGKTVAGENKSSISISIFFHCKKREKEWGKHQEKIKVWLALSKFYSCLEVTLWKHRYPSSSKKQQKPKQV